MSNQVHLRLAGATRQDSELRCCNWNRGSASATALARAAFGADAAGAGANNFVAAADGTGDTHEDAAERYRNSVR